MTRSMRIGWDSRFGSGESLGLLGLGCFIFSVSLVLYFPERGMVFSRPSGRVARPCVLRVRLLRCPASAPKRSCSGPLGDNSGSFSLVLVSRYYGFNSDCVVMKPWWWRLS